MRSLFRNFRKKIALNSLNFKGWSTNRKIVVIESDDWGSIRMPSKEVYELFFRNGISVDKSPYCMFDSLASEEDLEALFEILSRYKDVNNNHPVITANCVVANPDFKRIKTNGFQKYVDEPFTETLKKYPAHGNSFKLWKQGMENQVFHPQFHGRVHLNVPLWMDLLKKGQSEFLLAFENGFWGLSRDVLPGMKISIQAAFDTDNIDELEYHRESIISGLDLFEELFGYRSKSFIANNFIWDTALNEVLKKCGVSYLQGMKYQKLPLFNSNRAMIRHHTGEVNNSGQVYLVRNCTFEPSLRPTSFHNVEECLSSIKNAFFWKKPAIITSHRINYIGFLEEYNRKKNLVELDRLLKQLIKMWPDVEFMTSDKLGEVIENDLEN